MNLNFCWKVLAAVAVSATVSAPALAVDPNFGSSSTQFGVTPFSYDHPGNPGMVAPVARDRYGNILNAVPVDGIQNLSLPNRYAQPDYSIDSRLPLPPGSPISGDPRLQPQILPPNQQPRWKLGVYSKDTDTGVRLISIVQGSAAARAGLEPNDVIVSVGGYQVGYVNGQLYDCATEFERSANDSGWVSMLVQDNRNGRLRNLPVQLESRYSRVQGTVMLTDRGQLPPGSVVVVELQEILRPNTPPVVLNRSRILNPTSSQIPFEINFDPQQIDSRRQYVLTGRVISSNQTIYAPRNTVQVLTPSTPKQVSLAFDRVSGGSAIGPYNQNAQLAQILDLYQRHLYRAPTQQEQMVWEADLARGTSLIDVKADIFGQNQFFNDCDRDERNYINRLHEINLGRPARAEELAYWMGVYNERNGVRSDVAREFLNAVGANSAGRVN